MEEHKVKHFRLMNGDEVIGELEHEDANIYDVHNPFVVAEHEDRIVLSKFVPFAENQSVTFKKNHVITVTALHSEMIRYYYNTRMLSKSSSVSALEGLMKVNEEMEHYMVTGDLPDVENASVDLSVYSTCASSNTVH